MIEPWLPQETVLLNKPSVTKQLHGKQEKTDFLENIGYCFLFHSLPLLFSSVLALEFRDYMHKVDMDSILLKQKPTKNQTSDFHVFISMHILDTLLKMFPTCNGNYSAESLYTTLIQPRKWVNLLCIYLEYATKLITNRSVHLLRSSYYSACSTSNNWFFSSLLGEIWCRCFWLSLEYISMSPHNSINTCFYF